MFDIVMGGNTELAQMAIQLGYTSLIIVYTSLDDVYKAQLPSNNGLKMSYAVMLDTTDKNKIMSISKEASQENILCLVKAKQPEFNRFIIEKTSAALVDAEHVHPKDHLHFRRSGLDQVLCKAAKKHFFSSLSSLFSLNVGEQAKILGRIKQNARFCSKYKVSYALCSFAREPLEMKGAHDMKMLWKLLGIKSDIF